MYVLNNSYLYSRVVRAYGPYFDLSCAASVHYIDSGITPGGFPLLHTNDIDELGLTIIGKILVKRALREVKET